MIVSKSNCHEWNCCHKRSWQSGRTSTKCSPEDGGTFSNYGEIINSQQTGNSCSTTMGRIRTEDGSWSTAEDDLAITRTWICCQSDKVGWKWRWTKWKVNYSAIHSRFNCFLILFLTFTSIFNYPTPVDSLPLVSPGNRSRFTSQTHSQNSECDWTGSGTVIGPATKASAAASLVQTVTLRCTRGSIHWTQPKGGLKVTISPNIGNPPYKLCLDNGDGGRRHRVLLEEPESEPTSGGGVQRRLLPILTRSTSSCYRVAEPSAVLYIESHGDTSTTSTPPPPPLPWQSGDDFVMDNRIDDEESGSGRDLGMANAILIAYEVESLRGDGDPCRPCSESEVLKTFCSSDVVARGSILQVKPGQKYDAIYIKADLVLHQNHPVFTPFGNLQPFLQKKPTRFDMDKPQRVLASTEDGMGTYGGIVSHPSTCSASAGPGDFLWLIKFRFGIPLVDCVIYWDKWVDIVRRRQGECPLAVD